MKKSDSISWIIFRVLLIILCTIMGYCFAALVLSAFYPSIVKMSQFFLICSILVGTVVIGISVLFASVSRARQFYFSLLYSVQIGAMLVFGWVGLLVLGNLKRGVDWKGVAVIIGAAALFFMCKHLINYGRAA